MDFSDRSTAAEGLQRHRLVDRGALLTSPLDSSQFKHLCKRELPLVDLTAGERMHAEKSPRFIARFPRFRF